MSDKQLNQDSKAARTPASGGWFWVDRVVVTRHGRDIGMVGVAVYNVLASMADARRECFPSQRCIADSLHCSRATVNKAIRTLVDQGLIEVRKRDRHCCRYRLVPLRCQPNRRQMSKRTTADVNHVDTNDNQLKRIKNENIVSVKKNDILPVSSKEEKGKGFIPTTREELLAYDLATALNDSEKIPWYLYLAGRYPENLLRRVLSEAKEVPQSLIRKSRTALFNHLLQRHGEKVDHYPRR